jgi:hypothetical protein
MKMTKKATAIKASLDTDSRDHHPDAQKQIDYQIVREIVRDFGVGMVGPWPSWLPKSKQTFVAALLRRCGV